MVFLDPTSDIAFKKMFGNQAKKEILIGFLNSVLSTDDDRRVVDVTISDPNNIPVILSDKYSIVDVKCTDQLGRHFIVEVQVSHQSDYSERAQYYSALALSRQLEKKGKYREVMPVIFIGVLSKDLFKSSEYLSHHTIRNTVTQEHALQLFDFYFIELSKFHKTINQLENVVDQWIYLLQNARALEGVPSQLKKNIEIAEAFEVLEKGNWSRSELADYDVFLDRQRLALGAEEDYQKNLERQLREGMEKGMEMGMEMGIEKGMEKGMEKGRQEEAYAIAHKMIKKGVKIEIIAEFTELSIEKIHELSKELKDENI